MGNEITNTKKREKLDFLVGGVEEEERGEGEG